jgi:hypothetical protein
MAQFHKLVNKLFLILCGHNIYCHQREMSEFLMRYITLFRLFSLKLFYLPLNIRNIRLFLRSLGFDYGQLIKLSQFWIYPPPYLLLKSQLSSMGLSVPHRKHITSALRVQQVNAIYRIVMMVY